MIEKFNVKVVYKDQSDEVPQVYEENGLIGYGFNNNQTMVYFTKKLKEEDIYKRNEKIFWLNINSIISMDVDYTIDFETKKEKLEYIRSLKR